MIFSRKSKKESGPGDAKGEHERELRDPKLRGTIVSGVKPTACQAPMPNLKGQDDAVANDLVRRVIQAMDGWVKANGLDAVPRHIIFEQVLSILNAMDRNLPARD
jgi:hypothetical protein